MISTAPDHERLIGLPERMQPWAVEHYNTPSPNVKVTRFTGPGWPPTYRRLWWPDITPGLFTNDAGPALVYEIGRISVTFRGWMARRIF